MANTMKRVEELAAERGLPLNKLAQISGVSASTLRRAQTNGSKLRVGTLEKLCAGLKVTMAEFFTDPNHVMW